MLKRFTAAALSVVIAFSAFTPSVYAMEDAALLVEDKAVVETTEENETSLEELVVETPQTEQEQTEPEDTSTDSELPAEETDGSEEAVQEETQQPSDEAEQPQQTEAATEDTASEEETESSEEAVLEEVVETVEVTVSCADSDLPSNDELFAGYVEQQLYDSQIAFFGISARDRLDDTEQKIYDFLKEKIETVAANGGSTQFTVADIAALGLKTTWTAQELGVTSIDDVTLAQNAFEQQFNFKNILEALEHDCPYELYWFNKVRGASYNYGIGRSYYSDAPDVYVSATVANLSFVFYVAGNYQSGVDSIVTGGVSAVATAKSNALTIADKHAGKNDLDKLTALKDEICSMVSYDHDAAQAGSFGLNDDPWQLINVFDGDSTTNVVCEGYSKAFQYLCDLSDFDNAECYTVSGVMSGGTGAGNHMWNIVSLDGENYLVDVTNSDSGAVGQDGGLFMAGAQGSVAEGYIFNVNGSAVGYAYDNDTKNLWDESVLSLAEEEYEPKEADVVDSGICGESATWTLYSDGRLVIYGEGEMDYYGDDIPVPWCEYTDRITSVIFEEGITRVKAGTLKGLEYVTEIFFSYTTEISIFLSFVDCIRLEKIAVDERNKYWMIYDDMLVWMGSILYACPEAKKGRAVLPNGTTVVYEDTFANCSQITELVLPDNIIKWQCDFSDLTGLKTIYVKGDGKAWENSEFLNGLYLNENVEIIYNYVDNSVVTTGKCGENASYTIDVMGNLVISGSGAMENYLQDGEPWFKYRDEIDNIIIGEGITHIGDWAFYKCMRVENVQFASTIESIGERAFSEFRKLKSLTIPGNVKHIGNNAFSFCYAETLTIEDGVETIGESAFTGNVFLEKVYIPDSVNSIGIRAFSGCYKIKEARLPSGITEIPEEMFNRNESLESIVIPEGVTSINRRAFMWCEALKNIKLPSTLTSIGVQAFYGCTSLETLDVPSSVTTIGENAFYHCSAIETIVYNDTAERWFSEFHEIVKAPPFVKYIFADGDISYKKIKSAEGMVIGYELLYWRGAKGDIVIPAEHNGLPVIYVGACALSYNEEITSVIFPETITVIKIGAFTNCTELEKLTVSDKMENINKAFDGCEKLKYFCFDGDAQILVDRYNAIMDNLTSIETIEVTGDKKVLAPVISGTTMVGYTVLRWNDTDKDIVIPGTHNGRIVFDIDPNAFAYNENITSVVIPETILKIKAGTFAGCTELTSLTITETMLDIEIGAFEGCDKLEVLYIEGDAQNVAENFDNIIDALPMVKNFYFTGKKIAFRRLYDSDGNMLDEYYLWCWDEAKGDIVIPDTYNGMPVVGIGQYVFMGQQDITSVKMSDNIEYVDRSAFRDCKNLKSVTFSNNVWHIGEYAFSGCTSLEKVYYPSSYNWQNYTPYIGVDNKSFTDAEFIFATDWGYLRYINDYGEEVLSVQGKNNIGDTLIIPSEILGITVEDVGAYVGGLFQNNTAIRNVVFTEGIKGIALNAFNGCSNIKTMVFPGSMEHYYYASENEELLAGIPDDAKIFAPNDSYARDIIENLGKFGPVQEYEYVPLEGLKADDITAYLGIQTEVPDVELVPSNASFGVNIQWSIPSEYADIIELVEGTDGKLKIKAKVFCDAAIIVKDINSGISTQIDINVKLPAKEKLTAVWDTEIAAIGLIHGESRQMQVTSPTAGLLPADKLNFVSSSLDVVSVDENGIITANYTGKGSKSATITATLKSDPTKSVKLTVKAIAKQTENVVVKPEVDEEYAEEIIVAEDEETGTPVIIIPKTLVLDGPLDLTLTAFDGTADGEVVPNVVWKSSDSKVAKVAAVKGASSNAVVTISKNADGITTITATADDLNKAATVIDIDVRDYTPRLENSTVTLNPNLKGGAEVKLYTAYDAAIVDYSEQTAMLMSADSQVVDVSLEGKGSENFDAVYNSESGMVVFSSVNPVKNGSYKLTLNVNTAKGVTSQAVTVKVANSLPKITAKQQANFELFYKSSTAEVEITAQDAVITAVEMVESDTFKASEYNGKGITISYIDTENPLSCFEKNKADTTVKLLVYLEGYEVPAEVKNFKIKAKETKPSLALGRSSTKFTTLNSENSPIEITDKKTKETIYLADGEAAEQTASEGYVKASAEDGKLLITPLLNEEGKFDVNGKVSTSHSAKIDIQKADWLRAVTVSHSISISGSTAVPTVKLKAASLTLNSKFGTPAETYAVPSLDNCPLPDGWTITAQPTSKQLEDIKKIEVAADGWNITAKFAEGEMPEKGSYKFSLTAKIGERELKAVTLTVKVAETMPKVSLSKTSVKLNKQIEEEAVIPFKVEDGYTVTSVNVVPAKGNTITEEEISVTYDEAQQAMVVKVYGGEYKNTSYKYVLTPVLKCTAEEATAQAEAKTISLSVSAYGNTPVIKASGKGGIDLINREAGIVYTITGGTNFVYSAADVKGEDESFALTGASAEKFSISYVGKDAKGQHQVMVKARADAQFAAKEKCEYSIAVKVESLGIMVETATIKVTPKQGSVKLEAKGSTSIIQSYRGTSSFDIRVKTPDGAKLAEVNLLETKATTLPEDALDWELTPNGDGSWKFTYSVKRASLLKAKGSYKLTFEARPEGSAEGQKLPTISVTLKVRR